MAKKLAFDMVLFTVVIAIVGLGLTMVYSASAAFARDEGTRWNLFLVKQSAAALLGLIAMWVVMHVDYRHLRRPAVLYTLVGGVLLLLVAVHRLCRSTSTRYSAHPDCQYYVECCLFCAHNL